MKLLGTFILCFAFSLAQAQFSNNQRYGGNITLNAPSSIDKLEEKQKLINKKTSEKQGYRVQILFSNNRSEIYNAKARFYKVFPDEKSYVLYEQPYFKLRIGDYQTKLEAHRHLNKIISSFPDAFVVLDKIKVN